MVGSMMFLDIRPVSMLGVIVGRVATMFFTPSMGVPLLWTAPVTSCSFLFYATNLLYNFSDLSRNKLHL